MTGRPRPISLEPLYWVAPEMLPIPALEKSEIPSRSKVIYNRCAEPRTSNHSFRSVIWFDDPRDLKIDLSTVYMTETDVMSLVELSRLSQGLLRKDLEVFRNAGPSSIFRRHRLRENYSRCTFHT